MKIKNLSLYALFVFALSFGGSLSAELASAKVTKVVGTVTKVSSNGDKSPLTKGTILKEGDAVIARDLSSVELIFSNGSEVTVEENSSVKIETLKQEAFSSGQSYEQLKADPSKSQTLLGLDYGSLDFHVKKLQSGSTFDIETPLGTAAIRGTRGTITLLYNSVNNQFTLQVSNVDGLVDFSSTFAGNLVFGPGNTASAGFNSSEGSKTEGIPQGKTVVLRISQGDPGFQAVVNAIRPFIPASTSTPKPPVITPTPGGDQDFEDDNDFDIIVVSPEGSETESTPPPVLK